MYKIDKLLGSFSDIEQDSKGLLLVIEGGYTSGDSLQLSSDTYKWVNKEARVLYVPNATPNNITEVVEALSLKNIAGNPDVRFISTYYIADGKYTNLMDCTLLPSSEHSSSAVDVFFSSTDTMPYFGNDDITIDSIASKVKIS